MAKGGREYKSEFGANKDDKKDNSSDLMDKDISFETRDMHKTWPMVKGCATLFAAVVGFIFLSIYVFKTFKTWFN